MLIRLFSDIHNEIRRADNLPNYEVPYLPTDEETTLVLAGDIDTVKNPLRYLEYLGELSKRFRYVLVVAGNHEFYGSRLDKWYNIQTAAFLHGDNIHVMEDTEVILDRVRFLGNTLWTDFYGGDPLLMFQARRGMNDYKKIKYFQTEPVEIYRSLRPEDVAKINRKSRYFLKCNLELLGHAEDLPDHKVVVITHHAPSYQVKVERSFESHLDCCYYNSLDNLFQYANMWLYGHTHYPTNQVIDGCQVVSNPVGYCMKSWEEDTGFDDKLILEI